MVSGWMKDVTGRQTSKCQQIECSGKVHVGPEPFEQAWRTKPLEAASAWASALWRKRAVKGRDGEAAWVTFPVLSMLVSEYPGDFSVGYSLLRRPSAPGGQFAEALPRVAIMPDMMIMSHECPRPRKANYGI
jgi:hypothetical protein